MIEYSSPRDLVITAVKNAIKKTDPTLLKILEVHLESREGKGLDMAYENPEKFVDSMRDLFGEYSGRFFELLLIQEVKELVGFKEQPNSLKEAIEILKTYVL
ncbi:hypothetical protein Asulf_01789 [Archaeoglobus sulfaticallidus PM70-1]|uniref:Nitrosopumilus output domain-containing protein n=1 Tax=Archaeoglobus sulfaticallidus PM70-1 TaxID=387631 RepID=N0BN78_9EURY|nr:DUF3227 domain-containing protein [Archaeoglobus sulfaticallidus]AGK61760.1 hypothetical protein Asulf_01789 [Archaeoglobus sulfaticallidus PM70-1]